MRKKQGLLAQRITDGLIIYDPDKDEAYTLNETGATIWENVDLGEDEIVRLLTERYGIEEDEAREDTRAFLQELREKGLLEDE
ncbi:MAG: PqqD family protein [candidate division WOR-3 bacterium]